MQLAFMLLVVFRNQVYCYLNGGLCFGSDDYPYWVEIREIDVGGSIQHDKVLQGLQLSFMELSFENVHSI